MTEQINFKLDAGNAETKFSAPNGKSPYFWEGLFTPSLFNEPFISKPSIGTCFDSMGYLVDKRAISNTLKTIN